MKENGNVEYENNANCVYAGWPDTFVIHNIEHAIM